MKEPAGSKKPRFRGIANHFVRGESIARCLQLCALRITCSSLIWNWNGRYSNGRGKGLGSVRIIAREQEKEKCDES